MEWLLGTVRHYEWEGKHKLKEELEAISQEKVKIFFDNVKEALRTSNNSELSQERVMQIARDTGLVAWEKELAENYEASIKAFGEFAKSLR
jgi:ABC-type transport system involved in cytochrome bd biosynthesis fused ATPase/permease subunit